MRKTKQKKKGNVAKIVSTNAECTPGFVQLVFYSVLLLVWNSHKLPRHLGFKFYQTLQNKNKKGSPSLLFIISTILWSSRGYIKNRMQAGRNMHGVKFNPWFHLMKSFYFTFLTKIWILSPTITK